MKKLLILLTFIFYSGLILIAQEDRDTSLNNNGNNLELREMEIYSFLGKESHMFFSALDSLGFQYAIYPASHDTYIFWDGVMITIDDISTYIYLFTDSTRYLDPKILENLKREFSNKKVFQIDIYQKENGYFSFKERN